MSQPVQDWSSDFDHTDPQWVADPYPIWDDLRATCPVAHSDRYGGVWLPTRHEDVAAIANDTEHFTSRSIIVANDRPPPLLAPEGIAPPISSDPPFHADSRRLLLPAFSPQAVEKLEPATRAHCEELVGGLAGRDVVDAAAEYAQHIPIQVIANMLGLPQEDANVFPEFVHNVLETVDEPLEARFAGFQALYNYLQPKIEERRAAPTDDLISYLIGSELDGKPVDDFYVFRTVSLLLIAGIDTTWSAIGASLWHLARTPSDRRRLVDDPALMPTAIEELLRAYAPVTMARLVKEPVTIGGRELQPEDWVLLSFPSANRDPEMFERADEVLLDRERNRHAAFGLGPHRCAGSHLARMELRVALEVWLDAFPVFELDDPDAVRWSAGQVRGPRALPLRIGG